MKHNYKLIIAILFFLLIGSFTFAKEEDNNTQIEKEESTEDVEKQEGEEIDRDALLRELEEIKERISYLKWRLEGVRLKKQLVSGSYIVLDINDKEVLIDNNANQKYPIASITKLMSSLIVKENKDVEEEVVLTNEMLSTIYNKTSTLFPNLLISIKNLLSASLISSINDAAESFNHIIEDDLILLMNKKTRTINMGQTSFVDAHGISKDNISSSNDVAKLLYYIYLKHPDLLEITANDDFWLPDRSNNLVKFVNRNLFHEVPEFIGGKTGFINASKQTFAGVFEFEEEPYIIVLLYSTNRLNDTKRITEWIKRKPQIKTNK